MKMNVRPTEDFISPEMKCQHLRTKGIHVKMKEYTNEEYDDNDGELEVEKTRQLFQNYLFSFLLSMAMSLYCGLHISRFANAMKSTSASDTPLRALLRYFDTLNHVTKWFESNSSRKKSLKTVQRMHRSA